MPSFPSDYENVHMNARFGRHKLQPWLTATADRRLSAAQCALWSRSGSCLPCCSCLRRLRPPAIPIDIPNWYRSMSCLIHWSLLDGRAHSHAAGLAQQAAVPTDSSVSNPTMYGFLPPAPKQVVGQRRARRDRNVYGGQATLKEVTVTLRLAAGGPRFHLMLVSPTGGTGSGTRRAQHELLWQPQPGEGPGGYDCPTTGCGHEARGWSTTGRPRPAAAPGGHLAHSILETDQRCFPALV